MNRLKKYLALGAFSLIVLGLPAIASAQWRDRDDDYYGNGNGRYNRNIRGTVQSLKNRARNFEQRTDRWDDRREDRDDRWGNRNGGYYGGGNLENLADRFAEATDDLADSYGRGRNLNNSADEARRVVDLARQIDQALYNTRGDRGIENQWSQIRYDVRQISDVYGYNYNDRNRNNRNNRNGGWRNRVPFPMPF
jgi:hypothetical protein